MSKLTLSNKFKWKYIFFFEWNSFQGVNLKVGHFLSGLRVYDLSLQQLARTDHEMSHFFTLHKMAAISQTIYSDAFYVNKKFCVLIFF